MRAKNEVLKLLIKAEVPMDSKDKDGLSFLHIAAKNGNANVIDIIIEDTSDRPAGIALIEARDDSGKTPLLTAVLAGHENFVKALLNAKANVIVEDNSGHSPLAMAKEIAMKTILRSFGAGGWTSLMIAVEQGGREFEQLLKGTEYMQCLRDRKEFPGWFQRLVRFHASLSAQNQGSGWVWGGCSQNLVVAEEGSRLSKQRRGHSAAVGSKVLEYGVHEWEIRANNVSNMWVGIARGIEENDLLEVDPSRLDAQYHDDVFMLAFQSDGTFKNCGKSAVVEVPYDQGFTSGQLIAFEVDIFRHTLSVKIDNNVVFFASVIDDRGIRPYVCMEFYETAVLVSSLSRISGDADTLLAEGTSIPAAWTWESDPSLATVDGGLFTRKKERAADSSPVSMLARRRFVPEGLYIWALQVKNVQDMWIGVAKGDSETLCCSTPKDCGSGEQVLSLRCSGEIINNLGNGRVMELSNPEFFSGQVVEVAVNVAEKWLKVRVDGKLVLVVSGVHMVGFQPYVSICHSESAVLQSVFCRETRFTAIQSASWRWGAREPQSLAFSGLGNETVTKIKDSPDYASVVGSEELDGGIQTWSMKVENVQSMWVGIARNAEENKALDKYPRETSGEDAYLIAFGCHGGTLVVGQSPGPSIDTSTGYYAFNSGQTVKLELDTYKHCLCMYIDEESEPTVTASNVDCRAVRPYVCMDNEESVTLLERTCRYKATGSLAIDDDDWEKGFNNTIWPEEVDEALIKHPLAGSSHFLLHKGRFCLMNSC